ncbi:hypothetical protein BKA70DRAFT_1108729 [Coprinopsis sp. MPI-PUGE-AT-0042]|nr:hypothetical protein BKA70DRAFT_1108729 [Coprinopsis sp. MPI-PUGE-AT-0042]
MKLVSSRPIRYHFQTKDTKEDVTFVVVASCTETWLREPRDSAYPAKVVKALGLSQEIQRIYGYFCMASNQKKLHAQLFEGSIDYSTQTDYGTLALGIHLFYMSLSLKSGSSGAMSESVDNYFLTINDTIPVYDGRNTYFDVTADLAYLKELLPLYEDEIPPHSCVVIGHTVTCYKRRAGCWGVGFNLKWVVVLATP